MTVVILLHTVSSTKQDEFDQEKFWSLETMGIFPQPEKNDDELFLENYINKPIARNQDGSYSANFPWKDDAPPLPTNYTKCKGRTRSMARRLAVTPELLATYGNIISEHEARGFIERVDDMQTTDKAHYIPHHPVKKESATTPIRIVYDCSFHSSPDTPSLNDCLLVRPPFSHDMCSIILRFRSFLFGFSADIEKAFLHMLVLMRMIETLQDFSGSQTPRIRKVTSKCTDSKPFCLVRQVPRSCSMQHFTTT